MRSRLLTILTIISVPLCLTACGFWVRSYWEADKVILSDGRNAKNGSFCQFALGSAHGAAALSRGVYSFQLPASRAIAGMIPDGLQLTTSPFVAPAVYPIASYAKTVKGYGLPPAANAESFNFIGFGFASANITSPRTGMPNEPFVRDLSAACCCRGHGAPIVVLDLSSAKTAYLRIRTVALSNLRLLPRRQHQRRLPGVWNTDRRATLGNKLLAAVNICRRKFFMRRMTSAGSM